MIGMSKYQRHARDVLGGDHEKAGTFASGAGDDDPHHAHGEELDAFDDDDDDDDMTLGGGSDMDEKLEEQLAAKSVVNHLTENYRVSSLAATWTYLATDSAPPLSTGPNRPSTAVIVPLAI